ncbi:inositol monophosphatase [Violaceomyces palustris]|uniref:Inositol monophosphatase n=1 Tax=Violaceomyces palustris TaxID=1673888 RepID=A0ACD0NVM9_9BASI|nr:inositol monophosphatase [Violaceomyces palustris]
MQAAEEIDLESIHDFATKLAIQAGTALRTNAFHRSRQGHHPASKSKTKPTRRGKDCNDGNTLNVQEKDSSVDIVTDVDLQVEKLILERIRSAWPGHKIIAEETFSSSGGSKDYQIDDSPTWIVDPLDGTVNFTHLFPLICVSIGFTLKKLPVVGVIYAPLLSSMDPYSRTGSGGTLWSSVKGRGAYQSYPSLDPRSLADTTTLRYLVRSTACKEEEEEQEQEQAKVEGGGGGGGEEEEEEEEEGRVFKLPLQPKRPLPLTSPNGLLLASEWGKDRSDHDPQTSNLSRKVETFWNLACKNGGRQGKGGQVHGIRSLGSAALDLAFCASGSVDIFWEGGCWEWDVCAGIAILLESGGYVEDSNPPDPGSKLWLEGQEEEGGSNRMETSSPLPCSSESDDYEQRLRVSLGARRFLCIRSCSPLVSEGEGGDGGGEGVHENVESSLASQKRVVREIWRRTRGLNYSRPGIKYVDRS